MDFNKWAFWDEIHDALSGIGLDPQLIANGEIASVEGVLADENTFNNYGWHGEARTWTSMLVVIKKYRMWVNYFKSRGYTIACTVRYLAGPGEYQNRSNYIIGLGTKRSTGIQ